MQVAVFYSFVCTRTYVFCVETFCCGIAKAITQQLNLIRIQLSWKTWQRHHTIEESGWFRICMESNDCVLSSLHIKSDSIAEIKNYESKKKGKEKPVQYLTGLLFGKLAYRKTGCEEKSRDSAEQLFRWLKPQRKVLHWSTVYCFGVLRVVVLPIS